MKKLRKTLDDYGIPKFSKTYEMPCGDRLEITLKAGRDDSPSAIGGGSVLKFYANYGRHIGGWAMDINADGHIHYPKLYEHTDRVIEAFNIFLTGFSKDFQEYVLHYEDDEYDESTKKFGKKFTKESESDDTEKEFTWMGLSITRYDYESLPLPMAATKCSDRMMKAIVKSIYYDLIDNCGWSPKDIEKYLAPGVDEYGFEGEEARKADKIKSDFWEYMEKAAVSHGMEYYEDMDDEEQVNESDDGSPWFDDRGDMLKTLPGDCILACSGQGRVDDDVAFWVEELDFTNGLPRERTINYLREYGAWDDEELNEMTAMSLAEKVLWIFCNDLKEQAYDMVGEDEELAAKLGDDPSAWGDREWEQFQNEYGYCTLSN